MDSYLVPSGQENGKARALTSDEEPANVLGQVVDAQQRDGRVMARVQPGMGIEPLRRWEGEQRREQREQRLREEREHERADAQNALHLTAAGAAPVQPWLMPSPVPHWQRGVVAIGVRKSLAPDDNALIGSGWIVDLDRGLLCTCAHVAIDCFHASPLDPKDYGLAIGVGIGERVRWVRRAKLLLVSQPPLEPRYPHPIPSTWSAAAEAREMIVYNDERIDLAILQLCEWTGGPLQGLASELPWHRDGEPAGALPLGRTSEPELVEGHELVLLGYGQGSHQGGNDMGFGAERTSTTCRGHYAGRFEKDISGAWLKLGVTIYSGHSGGPVVNASSGAVVGWAVHSVLDLGPNGKARPIEALEKPLRAVLDHIQCEPIGQPARERLRGQLECRPMHNAPPPPPRPSPRADEGEHAAGTAGCTRRPERIGWACGTCTLSNDPGAIRCAVCDAERREDERAVSSSPWACSTCTLLNEPTASRCAVCNAMRGSSLPAAATLAVQAGGGGSSLAGGMAGGSGGQEGSAFDFTAMAMQARAAAAEGERVHTERERELARTAALLVDNQQRAAQRVRAHALKDGLALLGNMRSMVPTQAEEAPSIAQRGPDQRNEPVVGQAVLYDASGHLGGCKFRPARVLAVHPELEQPSAPPHLLLCLEDGVFNRQVEIVLSRPTPSGRLVDADADSPLPTAGATEAEADTRGQSMEQRLRAAQADAREKTRRAQEAKAREKEALSAERERRMSADPECRGTLNAAQLLDVRINSSACTLFGCSRQRSERQQAWRNHSCSACPQRGPIYGLRYHCSAIGEDLCEPCWQNLPTPDLQDMYTLAARHPVRGSWPWDEPGMLDEKTDSFSSVTPSVAKLNRAGHKYKLFQGWGFTGGPAFMTKVNVKMAGTGEELCAATCTWRGDHERKDEAIEEAWRQLLEKDTCKLLQVIDERDAQETAGCGAGGGSAGEEFATGAMRRLHERALKLSFDGDDGLTRVICAPDLEWSSAVVNYSSAEETAEGGEARFRVRTTLLSCKGEPSITGAVAASGRTAKHAAAERACAFVDRVVDALSDSSYAFGYAQLQQLLNALRTSGSGMAQGAFKELLHVIAMRIKRSLEPVWVGRSGDADTYLRYELIPSVPRIEMACLHATEPLERSLERSSVTFLLVDGEPTFYGEPAAGREAAEQSAAEAALIFICVQTARLKTEEMRA